MSRRHQLRLNARRQRVGTEIHNSGKLPQVDARRAVNRVDNRIVDEVEFSGRRLQNRRCDVQNIFAQYLGRLQRGLAANSSAARCPGAAAVGRIIGIAKNDANALHGNPEHAADDLCRERFRALPLLGDAGLADYRTGGVQPHRDTVLR